MNRFNKLKALPREPIGAVERTHEYTKESYRVYGIPANQIESQDVINNGVAIKDMIPPPQTFEENKK